METLNRHVVVHLDSELSDVTSCAQALASVDIGSLICNVGAGGGAAPAAAAAAAAPAGGDAPGNLSLSFRRVHVCLTQFLNLFSVCITAKEEEKKKEEKKEESEESDDDMGFGLFD